MGAHHYHIELIPRQSLGTDPEVDDVWSDQPPAELLVELRTLLPRDTSWGGVEEYKSDAEWGSDLRIWHEEGVESPVFSIVLRYAPAADAQSLLERYLALAANSDLLLYSKASEQFLEPNWDDVVMDMRTTPAFQFISDPEGAIVRAAASIRSNSDDG